MTKRGYRLFIEDIIWQIASVNIPKTKTDILKMFNSSHDEP